MKDGRPRPSFTTLARILSIAGHPFLLIPLTVAASTKGWKGTAVVAGITILPLLAIVIRNVRRGRWSDHDVSRRDQRAGLYLVAAPLVLLAALVLYFLGASTSMLRAVGAAAAMLAVGLAANRWLKISMHMMCAAFCGVLLGRLYPWTPALSIPFTAAVAWSRWKLERHTPLEIALGLVLGTVAGFMV